jgi:hypothetical protein
MARASISREGHERDTVPKRWWFYFALALATALALVAARILGMPRGMGVTQEPEETGEPDRTAPSHTAP